MNGNTEDHDRTTAAETPEREWVKPAMEIVPMKEAMGGVVFHNNSADAPFGYS
jgi:hypothetical protein